MEDLIWKYIDNTCNDEEIKQFKYHLSSDENFRRMYEECLRLNDVLEANAYLEPSLSFKSNLVLTIEKQVAKDKAKTEIFPIWIIISLSILTIGSTIIALIYPDHQGSFMDFKLPLDERSVTIATWSMICFIGLFFVDYCLKYGFGQRKQTHLFA